MAIVIDPKNWKEMCRIAAKYNLDLTQIGKVTSGEP